MMKQASVNFQRDDDDVERTEYAQTGDDDFVRGPLVALHFVERETADGAAVVIFFAKAIQAANADCMLSVTGQFQGIE